MITILAARRPVAILLDTSLLRPVSVEVTQHRRLSQSDGLGVLALEAHVGDRGIALASATEKPDAQKSETPASSAIRSTWAPRSIAMPTPRLESRALSRGVEIAHLSDLLAHWRTLPVLPILRRLPSRHPARHLQSAQSWVRQQSAQVLACPQDPPFGNNIVHWR